MIYFFCGAPKNGSHFQLFTVTESLAQKGIPYEPRGGKLFDHREYTACRKLLDDLESRAESAYILKGHWSTPFERRILLSYRTIRIFHIWRELRDALVSTYHYELERFGKPYSNFADYFRRDGKIRTIYLILYQRRWGGLEHPRVHHTEFASLKLDFPKEARKLLDFAGIEGVDLEDLERRISLDRLRKRQHDPNGILFRKGVIGDHSEIIDSPEIYRDIERLKAMSTFRLHWEVLLLNPKMALSGKFNFPARRPAVRLLRLLRRGEPTSQSDATKRGKKVWWE